MASFKPFSQTQVRRCWCAAYFIAIAAFGWICAHFYIPGQGFTYLIMFSDAESGRYIPELRAIDFYEFVESGGYDAQWYAQLAMHPNVGDPVLQEALDGPAYRARRILFSWLAYALAGGDPVRALHIFAVENIVGWFLLAALLWRWFPPRDASNFVRWFGVMYSLGLCFSVGAALTDGPSLLLIATGLALAEAGRPWWSAAVLGIAGLGKETNVLAAAGLLEGRMGDGRRWLRWILQGLVVAIPLAAWVVVLEFWIGRSGDLGQRNFAGPFVGYVQKWRDSLAGWADPESRAVLPKTLLVLVSLTTQWLFFVLRPRWRELWWRVGAAYAMLMIFLGGAVWEGYPEAAVRVLLPMALAFNVLVPRGRWWWGVLLLGNLTVLLAPDPLRPPAEGQEVRGSGELRRTADTGKPVDVVFDRSWHPPERQGSERWRWSRGPAPLTVQNPHPFALVADLTFQLESDGERRLVVRQDGQEVWSGVLPPKQRVPVEWRGIRLRPGANTWHFETDTPAAPPGNGDERLLAFRIRNLEVRLTGRGDYTQRPK